MHTRALPDRVRFGVFEADLRSSELRKGGVKIKLHHQPFQVLVLLLERPGELVTREELQRKLWSSDTFVDSEVGLNTAIKKLREALHDSAESPRYVETLPRRGYRFIAPVEEISTLRAELAPEPNKPQTGEERSGPSPAVAARSAVWTSRRWMLGGAAAVVIPAAMLVWVNAGEWRQRPGATGARPQIRSIAVLPLENLSGDPGQEYFTDGMTDALITDLAQISSLKVISRTSVMRYKGTHKPLPEISKELNVDGIVEGTVTRSADRLRVDAQLIEANSDRHFWARSYERKVGDAVALQTDLARAIADEIQAKLTPQEQSRLLRTESVDPETYELYLRGRYFWNKRTDASLEKSIDYFQQAIQRNPQYAPAYAAMAEAYAIRVDLPPEESSSKAKAAARAALQIDETLAEAHSALAMSLCFYDWDWAGAENEFRRALTLNPNYAIAHQWYAQYLRTIGRQDLAIEELKRAQELDPLSLDIAAGSGRYGEQYDLIIENNQKKLELDPNFPHAYMRLGRAYALKGMYRDAIAAYQKARDLSGEAPGALCGLGYTYGISGKRAEALRVLGELKGLSKSKYVSPYYIAKVYVGLGEKDLAFDWLQKAVLDHSIPLPELRTEEELASLRSDPRYRELERRIGLPP
jgi:TolB-like protein/DNA-binding winged helix-turn-helix (wHTH) protein/Flp pilus assembly protein TadD